MTETWEIMKLAMLMKLIMIRYIPVHHFSSWRSFQLKTLKIKLMQILNDCDQVINAIEQLIRILPGVTPHFAKFNGVADWVT